MQDKILTALHRIEELYHETDGKCFVSFSGGKDSTVLLALIKMSIDDLVLPKEGIKAVFANTGIELQVTIDFVKWCKENYYSNIEIIHPEKPFAWVLNNQGKPMKSKLKSELLNRWHTNRRTDYVFGSLIEGKLPTGKKYSQTKLADKDMHMVSDNFDIIASNKCCDYMKKRPFASYEKVNDIKGQLIGIRTGEGGVRTLQAMSRVQNGGKLCTYTKNGVIYKAPIIDWTDEEVDVFIEKYNVPLSDAYTKYGFFRTGCMACPYAKNIVHDLQYLHDHEQNRYKASMYFLKDVYIAQNVILPFDEEYEAERIKKWQEIYEPMRNEMLKKYRPNSRLIKKYEQTQLEL